MPYVHFMKPTLPVALSAVLISSLSALAQAKTPVSCTDALDNFTAGRGAYATGTVVGKSETDWSMVQLMTAPSFDDSDWKPSEEGASKFYLDTYDSYMRGDYQGLQVSSKNNQPFSDDVDLWIYKSGIVWSRNLTWGSSWTRWEDVTCYSAPSNIDSVDGEPLGRVFITAFNPYGGSNGGTFMTLEIRESPNLF
ncbi:hypothetical protein [Saccharospirillum salsuginis]|uniref:Uncharacterized protein n=1 Tax=Saccharospirillum salsuginis TaxID=418750 RepID=A0A918KMH8_9GAMM|nr:hypothetical protein [Saccharospirillum salsuginis]GGX66531.1 hypothetical protein GCM10007392_37800 [Saccharospirillum salsuginis]